jgi:corrinoid protein of di/trimethylamine methyltransferase
MTTLQTLVSAVIDGDESGAVVATKKVIEEKIAIEEVISTLTQAIREVGEMFARMEIFLPGMVMSSRAMKAAMNKLEPEIKAAGVTLEKKGCVVIGTVEGDMHEIGKFIVITVLQAQGFEVHDLGIDVNALDFVKKAEEVKADIIGSSSLMTTTMPKQREIITILEAKGLRDKYHVILGGAPVTQEWVDESGADSWGENASVAVDILERVMEERGK